MMNSDEPSAAEPSGPEQSTQAGLQLDLFDPANAPPRPLQGLIEALDDEQFEGVAGALDELIISEVLGVTHRSDLLTLRTVWDDPIDSVHVEQVVEPAARSVLGCPRWWPSSNRCIAGCSPGPGAALSTRRIRKNTRPSLRLASAIGGEPCTTPKPIPDSGCFVPR